MPEVLALKVSWFSLPLTFFFFALFSGRNPFWDLLIGFGFSLALTIICVLGWRWEDAKFSRAWRKKQKVKL